MKITNTNVVLFVFCAFLAFFVLVLFYMVYIEYGLFGVITSFFIALMFLFVTDIIKFEYEIKLPWERDKMTEEERELFEEWKKGRDGSYN